MSEHYIQTQEPLYYLCRLDRYTPATARFISYGARVTTPLTQDELVAVILNDRGDYSREYINRRLHEIGSDYQMTDAAYYHRWDNNHSGYWKNGFVHALGHTVTFWNLDEDFEEVLREALRIDETAGAGLARPLIFDLLENEDKLVEAACDLPDSEFFPWLADRKAELPDRPGEGENYDPAVADTYYDAVEDTIFKPLSETSAYNEDFIRLILRTTQPDPLVDEVLMITTGEPEGVNPDAERTKDRILDDIARYISPKNDKAGGYIRNGFRTMIPNDAMRGAIYAGNVCQVLETHERGLPLLPEDKRAASIVYAMHEDNIKEGKYPAAMRPCMPSDWLTDGPYKELVFKPGEKYPQMGWTTLLAMEKNYDKDVEKDIVINPPVSETLQTLIERLKEQQPAPGAAPA